MIILEYFINIINFITNPWGCGDWKTIDWMLGNNESQNKNFVPINEYIHLENKLDKINNEFEIQKKDYEILKRKARKISKNYKIIDNLLKQKDIEAKKLFDKVNEQKALIIEKEKELNELMKTQVKGVFIDQKNILSVEKDKKIMELMDLCNEFEERLNSQDLLVANYEDIIKEYKVQLTKKNIENNFLHKKVKEQEHELIVVIRKNKSLIEELKIYKKD